jgi:hypothetical protein
METATVRPKIKLDLIKEIDKITSQNTSMKPDEIRSLIGHIFKQRADAAGWDFRSETWPLLRKAIEASINAPGEKDDRDTHEVIGYITYLQDYCE